MVIARSARFPLEATRLVTGFIGIKAIIDLGVRTRHHEFQTLPFLVDSGSNVSTLPASLAETWDIPFPNKSVEIELRTATRRLRQRVHPANLVVRIPAFAGRDFAWPCHVVDRRSNQPQAVLGLAGVLQDFRITFDGAYALEARHGWLILEEVTSTA